MRKYDVLGFLLLLLISTSVVGQAKYEREYRILKSQFPAKALGFLEEHIADAKNVRYYREVDSVKISYEAKFKLDRLRYSVEFDKDGNLEDVEILIKKVDIPNESLENILAYLDRNFTKYRIEKIQQQYPVTDSETVDETLYNAFQNLLIPSLNYELIVAGKKGNNGYHDFEILFDAEGNFVKSRRSLPANYDHVLY